MPAKKIMEAVASTLVVMGSSMATATAGPMPGSTPTAVPMTQPTNAHIRLMGVAAVAKPARSALRMSMEGKKLEPAAGGDAGQVDRQELGEHPVHRGGDGEPHRDIHDPGLQTQVQPALRRLQAPHGQHEAKRAAEDEADRRDGRGIEQQRRRNPGEAL